MDRKQAEETAEETTPVSGAEEKAAANKRFKRSVQRERRDREGEINKEERQKYQFCKKNYSRPRVFFNLSPWAGKTDGSLMV